METAPQPRKWGLIAIVVGNVIACVAAAKLDDSTFTLGLGAAFVTLVIGAVVGFLNMRRTIGNVLIGVVLVIVGFIVSVFAWLVAHAGVGHA